MKSPLHDVLKCENSQPCWSCMAAYQEYKDDELIELKEQLVDFLTPNARGTQEMAELLLIERELTLREDM